MTRLALGASWVLPIDGPPLRDGRVVVEDGSVIWVGEQGDPGAPEGTLRDLGSLAPGKRAALAFSPTEVPPANPHAHLVAGEARLERVRLG